MGKNKAIEKEAEALYNKNLPYHNYQHALETIKESQKIINNCEKENIPVNKEIVYYSLLFHDAGYHENPASKGFKTKEEHSAFLAEQTLQKFNLPQSLIKRIKSTILSTHKDASFTTNEEKIVRASDLAGMTKDYKTFKENTKKLKEETEMLTKTKITWKNWKIQTKELIEFYLKQDIRLTKAHDEEGISIFHKKVRENLNKFLSDSEIQ